MSKQAGRMSQGSNDFLMPYTPTIGTATDVGTNRGFNDGAVSVTFTHNGPYAATSYTVLASTGQSATGASSPIVVTGFATGATPTFTVKATNDYGDSAYSSASNQVTVTTVPQAPAAPSVSSPTPSAGVNQAGTTTDTVSWSAPANNGGKSVTNYGWSSSDSKSGETTGTSVSVNQEGGTSQTYQVRAYNANGWSSYSVASSSITTFSFSPFSVFSFSPFGVFSFSPFGFSPFGVFSFSPFGVFSFSPFGVFSFSPFGFSPFGFSPFGFSPFGFSPFGFSPYGFSPFGFSPFIYSLGPKTKVVMADGTMKEAQDLVVGDQLKSAILPGLDQTFTAEELEQWIPPTDFNTLEIVTTTVNAITTHQVPTMYYINGDAFSNNHLVLCKRGSEIKMLRTGQILQSDLVWNHDTQTFVEILQLESVEYPVNVVNINCEPYDVFFTEKTLTHDGNEYYLSQE